MGDLLDNSAQEMVKYFRIYVLNGKSNALHPFREFGPSAESPNEVLQRESASGSVQSNTSDK